MDMSRTCYMTFSQGTLPTRCGRSLYVSFICVLMCVRTRIPKRIVKYPYLKLCVCDTGAWPILELLCLRRHVWVSMHVRVLVCVYMCVYVSCTCMSLYVCVRVCVCPCMRVSLYVHVRVCACPCMGVSLYVHVRVCACPCMCVSVYVCLIYVLTCVLT